MVQNISKSSSMAAGDMIINAENLQIKNVEKHKPSNLGPTITIIHNKELGISRR
jgi:hypothetical protein